ncbi:MAG: TonB-dependent receptor, partial [Ignavibacteria bacterium]|nr:TonB-dependent receptor [Ignavibacteria bacterium]
MNNIFKFFIFLILLYPLSIFAQTGIIKGKVNNSLSNESLFGVSVAIQGTSIGTVTDVDGNYELKDLKPGYYNLDVIYIGYKRQTVFEIQVSNAKVAIIDIAIEEETENINEVEIQAAAFTKPQESPVSLRTIGVAEIKRNPGGNRDISKVIQSLPGVAAPATFRNDIIVRGGSPNENRFFLDGIEIPNINHFATQGASGGPVGLINVDFIREVDFYSGAFPANRGNSLSSVFEFKLKDGNSDKIGASLTAGSSDFALAFEGPIDSITTFIASYRVSYLQALFKVIGLPFLPQYNDFQFKTKTKINAKNELVLLGIGAIDRFTLNLDANETEDQLFLLANLPVNTQDNYTIGANYKNYRKKGFSTLVISRNALDNRARKFKNNDENQAKILDYSSQETENKFRLENTSREKSLKLNYGISFETVKYRSKTFNVTPFGTNDFDSKINFVKYGIFAQVSRGFIKERLQLSAGLRTDAANYSDALSNLSKQLSPRLSASYNLTTNLSVNANSGIYYQLPAFTVLGFRDLNNQLVNKSAGFIRVAHQVFGIEYNTLSNLRFTVESFYKQYSNYPMLQILGDTIPLANLGADFGVTGNLPVAGSTKGRSYGLEFLAQQKLNKGFYGIVALTLVRSEFQDKRGNYRPSAWDSKYIVSTTAGKLFKRNWEIGAKLRLSGGAPFTPFDVEQSSLKSNFEIFPQGILDYDNLNTNRLKT